MMDLDAIEAAEKAMTAAPWAANGLDSGDERWRRANSVWTNHHPIARDEDGEEMCVASSSHDWGTVESPDERDANMRGIAILRNAAPEMIRCIREQDAEIERLKDACSKQDDDICQTLGKALGYPRYSDDPKNFPGATEANGVCVGDHVAESLADEAAREIKRLRELCAEASKWCDELRAPGLSIRLRAASKGEA